LVDGSREYRNARSPFHRHGLASDGLLVDEGVPARDHAVHRDSGRDIFTPEARPVIKRLVASVFGGPDGKQLKASIMDENPVTPAALKLTVNSRYPDTVPLTTVPPQVLQTMPKLTEDIEYHFIGDWLILPDVHAHVIADFIEDVLPK
jgi:hypothetical protein